MWRTYVFNSIRNNKTTCLFLAVIVFLASVLLFAITGMFYNVWMDYYVNRFISAEMLPTSVFAYGFVLLVACLALVSMVHNAFGVSMQTRVHQLGILQSVGATPRQIRTYS